MNLRLYIDEDAMSKALVQALRARGVDVMTAREAGMIGRNDEDHLEYAAQNGRALYTFNQAHYCRLHSEFQSHGRPHAGIVFAQQQNYSVGVQLLRLMRLMAAKTAEEMKNHVEFLSAWKWADWES